MIAGLTSAAGAAVLALGTLTAGAVAAPNPGPAGDGPQSANIPYVAWVGEHVRLVACDPSIVTANEDGQTVNFQLEDWSGRPETAQLPAPEPGSSGFFAPSPGSSQASIGAGCVKVDYKGLDPGLARIRVVVTNEETGKIAFSHQFLVIWMTANKPVLTELPSSGDPSGNGEFAPSPFSEPESGKGLVQVKVTGSFPVEVGSSLHNVLPEASYTLPASWETLAKALASASGEKEPPGSNPSLWDIHGSPENSPTTSAFGPFDPEAAETLLSNGSLNADDAPMPAIRIDVHMAANEGGSSLGGTGQISGASKALVYTNNPYYGAYIPATDRPVPQASGIDGPSPGGDFPGFLNKHPEPYMFWTSVASKEPRPEPHSTGCLRRKGAEPSEYQTPGSGPLTETFYTDERGEVLVAYTPGDGFYLERFPVLSKAGEEEKGKIIHNADGGCDLKNIFKEVIGEASISATAVYPYQPVDFNSQSSEAPVVKKIRSFWEKEFFTFPKGPGNAEQNLRIVVAKAQDIDGRPIVNETVCFHAQQEAGIHSFSGELEDPEGKLGMGSPVDLSGGYVRDPSDEGTSRLCKTTNALGLAAIELENSTSSSVDLTVRYEEEGVIRDHTVDFSTNLGAKEAKEKKEAEEKAEEAEDAAEAKAEEAEDEAEATAADEAEDRKALEAVEAEQKQHAREEETEKRQHEKEAAAEKRQNEREKAKEEFEKRTAAEIEANSNKRAAEEAAERTRRETEAAAEKARREAEVEKHKKEAEAQAKLVSPLAGGLTGSPNGHGKAHVATKKKKGKKSKKHKK